jgi:hypothetical protein
MRLDFTLYLLNEQRAYLGQKLGDILTAVQNLHDDAANLGTRQLTKATDGIVKQIRRIIKDEWPDTELPTLQTLQRVAVALAKAIDENADLKDVIAGATQELQKASGDLEEPVNNLGSEDEPPADES